MRRDVFQAIADPTRREIITLLASRPQNLNSIAEQFAISRPAISKHIKILAACGLIAIQPKGRERYCTAYIEELDQVADWITYNRKCWNARLDSLEGYLGKLQSGNRNKSKR